MTPIRRDVTIASGLRMSYAWAGDPAGPPVLLLHGLGESWRGFAATMAHLPPALHAIAPSLRGHGQTDKPAAGYTIDDLAADLEGFMAALGVDPVLIAGHCLGGSVALRIALRRRRPLQGLALLATVAAWRDHPDVQAIWDDTIATLTDPIDPGFLRAYLASKVTDPIPEAVRDMLLEEGAAVPAHAWRGLVRTAMLNGPYAPPDGSIALPTLILDGERDEVTREGQAALRRVFRAPLVETLPGAGHALHWERPARCAALIGGFAAGLVRAS